MLSNRYLSQGSISGQVFHSHEELEVIIVTEGSIDLKVGYEWLHLHTGQLMLVNSDEMHIVRETDESNKVVCIYIDSTVYRDRFPEMYEIIALLTYSEAFERLGRSSRTILGRVSKLAHMLGKQADQSEIDRCMDSLVSSLVACYRPDPSNHLEVIYRTIKYLYSNYEHKVNLQDISEQEHLSLYYLSHSYKDITGYNFRDWLNFVRSEKAEKLLLQTSLPLTEIAFRCGFSDVRYFKKHFSKWYRIGPAKYRTLFKSSYETDGGEDEFGDDASLEEIVSGIRAITAEKPEEKAPHSASVKLDFAIGTLCSNMTDAALVDNLRRKISRIVNMHEEQSKSLIIDMFVPKVGELISESNSAYIITACDGGFRCCYYREDGEAASSDIVRLGIDISNMTEDCKILRYSWSAQKNGIMAAVKDSRVLEHLTDEEYAMLGRGAFPQVYADYISVSDSANNSFSLTIDLSPMSLHAVIITQI